MCAQAIPRSFFSLVSLYAVLTIGIAGCSSNDNNWVGTWALETLNGKSLPITVNEWTFNDDGTMEVQVGMKFERKREDIALLGEGSIKITGTYSLSGSNFTLTPTTIEGIGVLGDVAPVSLTEEVTGTWSRKGNTFTLNYPDGSTLVLKKQ